MKKMLPLLLGCLLGLPAIAQVTFSEDIAPILYDNCTSCHRDGNIAPFPLVTYDDAVGYAASIKNAVEKGEMPPWPPDTTFQRYAHERLLTPQEKNDLISWIDNGTPEGDTTKLPPLPDYPDGSVLGTPDLQLKIPKYTSQASTTDEYKCFYLATQLPVDRKVQAIEILPGNREIVHHVLVYVGDSSSAPVDSSCKTQGLKLMTGYTPGAGPTIFPHGTSVKMGMTLPAGAVILLQIHYPAGTQGMMDETAVNFFFYPENETNVREVSADAILQNWTLFIPANTEKDYTAQYPSGSSTIPYNFSVLSVFPHMHLIGTRIESYAVDGQNDTIPFSRIPDWDFDWQGFYNFKKIVKLPAGSKMYANAHYDNTTANPHNPSNPPKLVTAGEATTDEMFLVYFHYLLYQAGDEYLDLDSLLDIPTAVAPDQPERTGTLQAFPNPSSGNVRWEFDAVHTGDHTLDVYTVDGKRVRSWRFSGLKAGHHVLPWNGHDEQGNHLPPGIYLGVLRSAQGSQVTRVAIVPGGGN
ncbi:MAG: hypothetical protein H6585_14735 [Flavobacteriales bacterium]|nr:hypothetical protein [Flavobacteriales bacterium]MCB9449586.1 hypothetical protein [Flavobacteriales bacterium]